MNDRLSKRGKQAIIINFILMALILVFHIYNSYQIHETQELIDAVIEKEEVSRDAAIDILLHQGQELFLGNEFFTYFGILMIGVSSVFLYTFAKKNGFFWGIFAGACLVFTTLIGGILLLSVILSGKSQNDHIEDKYALRNDFEKFVHKRANN